MTYLIFVLISFALLVGFFALVWYEGEHGVRILAQGRTRLDRYVERVEFILKHVDLGAFLRGEVRRVTARFGHDIAHLSLLAVRAIERLLTRLVRHLRTQHVVDATPRRSAREFVKTLSDFKGHLEATRPEIPEV